MQDFCQLLSVVYQDMNTKDLPIQVADLALAAATKFCEMFRYKLENPHAQLTYERNWIVLCCVGITLYLTSLSIEQGISKIHRYVRLDRICTFTGLSFPDCFLAGGKVKEENPGQLPVFVRPPSGNELPSRFWINLIKNLDLTVPGVYNCPVCGDDYVDSNFAILGVCEHMFCLPCAMGVFLAR